MKRRAYLVEKARIDAIGAALKREDQEIDRKFTDVNVSDRLDERDGGVVLRRDLARVALAGFLDGVGDEKAQVEKMLKDAEKQVTKIGSTGIEVMAGTLFLKCRSEGNVPTRFRDTSITEVEWTVEDLVEDCQFYAFGDTARVEEFCIDMEGEEPWLGGTWAELLSKKEYNEGKDAEIKNVGDWDSPEYEATRLITNVFLFRMTETD